MTLTTRELGLLGNTDVLGYIRAQNAARDAQAVAEGWDFWTNMSEDLAGEYANVYELELCSARDAYCEWHKDVWGTKRMPSKDMTLAEVEAENVRMAQTANEQWEAEKQWEAEQALLAREEIALGLAEAPEEVELEDWEIYEAKAEAMGF